MESGVRVTKAERDGGRIATVVIDNPAKLNTLNTGLMRALVEAIEELGRDTALRAVVLTGAGERAFIGGADIGEIASLDRSTAETFITWMHRSCDCMRQLPVPVIARIRGFALGGGLEIAAACDMRVAASDSFFGMPEVRIGVPSVVEAALLPQLIGWGRTRQLVLTGDTIGAAEAAAWGLVEQVVEPDALDAAVDRWLHSILASGPRAVRLQKELVREWEGLSPRDAVRAGIACFVRTWEDDEPRLMAGSFLERMRARRQP